MNSVGSVWQKWDLHIHTPASYHWKGQRFDDQTPAQQDAACKSILDRMNELDVVAFCIMDYWFFEGYFKLRDYIRRNPGCDKKRIFPGIELRVPVAADYRLNAHVLFDDGVSEDSLRFFHGVLRFHGRPDKPLIRQNFIDIAREYDEAKLRKLNLKAADKGDDDKMYLAALKSVLVSFESLQSAIKQMGEGTCLLVLPYDTNDGVEDLDWETHLYEDHALMKAADCFEARKKVHVDLFLGRGHPKNPQIGIDFITNLGGYPKPVFSGSDAHQFAEYGVYPNNRITWLKAQPTFKGLIQICCEPTLRCHIGDRPEKLLHVENNPTKYIKSLTMAKTATCTLADERWFHGKSVQLNPGLIAIIGNKGSGKSALADILALAGNSHCADLEFLTEERFRGTGNKAAQFEATLVWADGTPVTVNLNDDFDPNEPERVRYLPQHFIEKLCNEISKGDNTNFNRELRKVIFNHVKEEDRLGHGSLDELLDYLVQSRKEAFAQEQQALHTLNDVILRNEQEMSAESIDAYEKALALKQLELDALDKNPLTEVKQPIEDPNDVQTKGFVQQIDDKKKEQQELLRQIQQAQEERQSFVAEQATLKRLSGHVDNFDAHHQKFVADHATEFENAGFDIKQIVAVTITRKLFEDRLAEVAAKLAEKNLLLDGKQAAEDEPEVNGLVAKAKDCVAVITKLQEGLNLPEREYQAYLKAKEERAKRRAAIVGATDRPETIEYYKGRIKRAKEVIPDEVTKLYEERRAIVRKLHRQLLDMRDDHIKMYAAVQKIATDAAKAADSIQIEFDASVIVQGFEPDFLAFIHRGRTGNYQGDDESKAAVKALLKEHTFNDTESVVEFTDALLKKLTVLDRDQSSLQIANQLRDKTKVKQLYDFIFGLGYLDIRYNLRLGGKDISQLSPGEKGALLLVFYLLLDTEEIPIIIDQPEHNLDNQSVVQLLVDCIRKARARRQVFIVTHNPNLAVYCDADQVICCKIDKPNGHTIEYSTGAIEDYDINSFAVNVLEGTYAAFDNRRKKWHKPLSGLC